jgi:formyltetrahydrofolate-dependent phosphoribosylglycinamide formyltransferase
MLQAMAGLNNKKKLAVFASGGGSNLGALINAVNCGNLNNAEIKLVISDNQNANALQRAKDANIKAICVPRNMFCCDFDYDLYILSLLGDNGIDFVVLAGYLKILTPMLINAYKGKILNIHPSLLPNFGGKGMYGMNVHKAVIDSKSTNSGCTVHLVTEEIDAGKIIAQSSVEVISEDTPETLALKVLEEEHKLYPQAIKDFIDSYSLIHSK